MVKSKESNPIKLYRGRIMHTEHSKYWMYINQINTMPMNILLPSFQINSHLESIKNLGKGKVVWISWVKFKLLLNIPEVLRWCFINNNNIQTIKCWFLFKVLIYRKFPYICVNDLPRSAQNTCTYSTWTSSSVGVSGSLFCCCCKSRFFFAFFFFFFRFLFLDYNRLKLYVYH